MRILVTGAAGFIGSHLCETLLVQKHKVKAFVRYNINYCRVMRKAYFSINYR